MATLLECRPELCRRVVLLAGADDLASSIGEECIARGIQLDMAQRRDLDAMTGGANHQGVVAYISPIPPADLDEVADSVPKDAPALIVVLDHCQDPHNLGAVIRTAEIAGALCVVCQKDRSAIVNGTVVKTSAGAALRLPVAQVTNVRSALESLKGKGFWAIGLDHRTDQTIWSSPLPQRLVLVVGSEGDGIAPLVARSCDGLVKIPMAGRTGNLNASVAAALGIYEWVRLYGAGGDGSGAAEDASGAVPAPVEGSEGSDEFGVGRVEFF